jgi:hypothetical protein
MAAGSRRAGPGPSAITVTKATTLATRASSIPAADPAVLPVRCGARVAARRMRVGEGSGDIPRSSFGRAEMLPLTPDMESRLSSMKGRLVSRGGWPFLLFACVSVVVIIGVAC